MKRKMAPAGSCLLPHLSPSWWGGCLLSRSQLNPCTWAGVQLEGRAQVLWKQSEGLHVGFPGWLLAWDEGKEDCIVATAAANRIRESLGNPPVFSITKIPWKINSQQASSFFLWFIWSLLPQLCCSHLDTESWKCQSPSSCHSSPGRLLGGECYSHRAGLKNDLLRVLNQHSLPWPAACCGNESWAALKIKPIFSAAAVNSISSLSSFLSPCPIPPFGVKMKAEACWEKQCSALFAG